MYTPLKSMNQNNKGYAMIEVILTLAITAVIAVILMLMLKTGTMIAVRYKKDNQFNQDFTYMHLYFQKQILKSDTLYIQDDVVYLKDMESSQKGYYNAYRYDKINQRIYRDKAVLQNGKMKGIGLGETSQFASQIQAFEMQWSESERLIRINLTVKNTTDEQSRSFAFRFANEVMIIE